MKITGLLIGTFTSTIAVLSTAIITTYLSSPTPDNKNKEYKSSEDALWWENSVG